METNTKNTVKIYRSSVSTAVLHGYSAESAASLFYEKRNFIGRGKTGAADQWLRQYHNGLSKKQKLNLKQSYARLQTLSEFDRTIYLNAFDISEHYCANWKDSGYKAMLVVGGKSQAFKYQQYFEVLGRVQSEVIISGTGAYESGLASVDATGIRGARQRRTRLKPPASEIEKYNSILDRYRHSVFPEIVIVIDNALVRFVEPRTKLMYLACNLPGPALSGLFSCASATCTPTMLQAQDYRVIIDYADNDLLKIRFDLDRQGGTRPAGLRRSGLIRDIRDEICELPRHHERLYRVFNHAGHWLDMGTCSVILADNIARRAFISRFNIYRRCVKLAMSAQDFVMQTPEPKIEQYQNDLAWFKQLYATVMSQNPESSSHALHAVNNGCDDTAASHELTGHIDFENSYDNISSASKAIQEQGADYQVLPPVSKAGAAAHVLSSLIPDIHTQNTAAYDQFMQQLQQLTAEFSSGGISETEYVQRVITTRDSLINQVREDVPSTLYNDPLAGACYEHIKSIFEQADLEASRLTELVASTALALTNIVRQNFKVRFWEDLDAQHRVMNMIDDYLYDVVNSGLEISLTSEQMDLIINIVFQQAREYMAQ